ncbi:MAG TPA: TetR/AcrR family transcriptional regulator, partial [Chloroflexia bacterium]|nr:TetR/AcrR family transcriptional regulator [Chloroflexia bacterium]
RQTRARILAAALAQFAAQGYAPTTMRDIAAAAGCSLGLAYRYFARKESLVLALYAQLEADFADQVAALPAGTVGARFTAAMQAKLAAMAPYRPVLRALFGAALDPDSAVAVLGPESAPVREAVQAAFDTLVAEASDAPPAPVAGALATVLYGLHLALVFVWLAERDAAGAGAAELIELLGPAVTAAGPLLALPGADAALVRLAGVTGRMLG